MENINLLLPVDMVMRHHQFMPKTSKVPAKEPVEEVSWPKISLKENVEVKVVEPEQIIVLDDFLTTQECHALIHFIDSLPLQLTPPPKRGEATRVNREDCYFAVAHYVTPRSDRTSITSSTFAATLFDLLSPHLPPLASFHPQTRTNQSPRPVLCNSNIRLYKYTEGQYFGPHYDESVAGPSIALPTPPVPPLVETLNSQQENSVLPTGKRTGQRKVKATPVSAPQRAPTWSEWTILIYLSGAEDGIVGGETVFYVDEGRGKLRTQRLIVPPLKRGSVLLHKHGNECLLHEGRLVQSGTKYVLRSDLMFGEFDFPEIVRKNVG